MLTPIDDLAVHGQPKTIYGRQQPSPNKSELVQIMISKNKFGTNTPCLFQNHPLPTI